jgi:hypothetical protein
MASFDLDTLEALPLPLDKSELLARIRPARSALEEVVITLDDDALNRADGADWRVRDHLSHLAAWERMLIAHLTDGADHAVAKMRPEEYADATLQQVNNRLHELHRGDTTDAVHAEFAAAHAALTRFVGGLSDAHLARPYWADDPARRPVIEKLSSDTYRHYLEHRRWIGELVKETGVRA